MSLERNSVLHSMTCLSSSSSVDSAKFLCICRLFNKLLLIFLCTLCLEDTDALFALRVITNLSSTTVPWLIAMLDKVAWTVLPLWHLTCIRAKQCGPEHALLGKSAQVLFVCAGSPSSLSGQTCCVGRGHQELQSL